jgi:hypothetical protein
MILYFDNSSITDFALPAIYSGSQGVTIILSTLINNQNSGTDSYVDVANLGYRALIRELQAEGRKIWLAEMNDGWIDKYTDHSDLTHPNANGYKKVAAVWAQAFESMVETHPNWIVKPIETDFSGDTDCYPVCKHVSSYRRCTNSPSQTPDGFRGPVKTQQGSGFTDGPYIHDSKLRFSDDYYGLAPEPLIGKWNHFHFAQLVREDTQEDNGKPLDEFVRILDPADRGLNSLPYMSFQTNTGNGIFDRRYTPVDIVQQGTPECLSRGVRFGDINGDGLDDFICIDPVSRRGH